MPLFRKLDRHPSDTYDPVHDQNGLNEKPPGHFDTTPAPAYPGTVEAPTNAVQDYPMDATTHGARDSVYTPKSQPLHQDPYIQPEPQSNNYGPQTVPQGGYPPEHHHNKEQFAPNSNPTGNPFNDPYHDDPNGQYSMRPAIPIESLTAAPATVHCPYCNTTAVTRPRRKVGNITHAVALVVCATVCLGFIPYFVNGIKDVDHYCGNCGRRVAKWHRSGWSEAC